MRCADYLAEYFFQQGVDRVFMVTGGGAMHLNDAFGRHGGYDITFCHHEQACAMAADAYFRVSGRPAVAGDDGTWGDQCHERGIWCVC